MAIPTIDEATAKINAYSEDPNKTPATQKALYDALKGLNAEQLTQAFGASSHGKYLGSESARKAYIENTVANVLEHGQQTEVKAKQDAIWAKLGNAFTPGGKINKDEPEKLNAAFEAVKDLPKSEVEAALKAHVKGSVAASFLFQAGKYNNDPARTIEQLERQVTDLNKQLEEARAPQSPAAGATPPVASPSAPVQPAQQPGEPPAASTSPAPAQAQPAPVTPTGTTTAGTAAGAPAAGTGTNVPAQPPAQAQPAAPANKIDPAEVQKATAGFKDPARQKVAALQAMLKSAGYGDLAVDGMVGPKTREALTKLGKVSSDSNLQKLTAEDITTLEKAVGDFNGVPLSHPNNKNVKGLVTDAGKAIGVAKVAETSKHAASIAAKAEEYNSLGETPVPGNTPAAQPQQAAVGGHGPRR